MTSDDERGRDAEPADAVRQEAEPARQRPRTRVVSEAIVAALSEEPRRRLTRVVSEAVVAAIPEEGEREPGGGADDEAGAES